MPDRVVDASVVAAFVFQEPRAEEARTLLAGVEIFAPTLLAYELASIARTKIVRSPEQRDRLLDALEIALALRIHWVDVTHQPVVRLALETGLSTYDASYLHVARTLAIPLITFDNRLETAFSTASLRKT